MARVCPDPALAHLRTRHILTQTPLSLSLSSRAQIPARSILWYDPSPCRCRCPLPPPTAHALPTASLGAPLLPHHCTLSPLTPLLVRCNAQSDENYRLYVVITAKGCTCRSGADHCLPLIASHHSRFHSLQCMPAPTIDPERCAFAFLEEVRQAFTGKFMEKSSSCRAGDLTKPFERQLKCVSSALRAFPKHRLTFAVQPFLSQANRYEV